MAQQLGNVIGFGTGGLEEAASTTGSPEVTGSSPSPRTGAFRLGLLGAATEDEYRLNNNVQSGSPDNDAFLLGFWIQFNDLSPTTAYLFYEGLTIVTDPAGTGQVRLQLLTDGNLRLLDDNGSTIDTTTSSPFTVNTWHRIEIRAETIDPGDAEVYVDGTLELSGTSDFGPIGQNSGHLFAGSPTSGENIYIDSMYSHTGSNTKEGYTLLGAFDVFEYQVAGTGMTENGTAPATGSWAGTGDQPINDSNQAEWTGSSDDASAECDGTVRAGPSGDSNVTGTIHGAKYIHRMDRDGGGATTHTKKFGNDTDTLGTRTVSLTTSPKEFFEVADLATIVPTSTQHFEVGITISGAQDLHLYEAYCWLLHVPAAVAAGNPMLGMGMTGILGG